MGIEKLERLDDELTEYAVMLGLIGTSVGVVFLGVQLPNKILTIDGCIMFELFFLLLIFKLAKRLVIKDKAYIQNSQKQKLKKILS